MTYMQRPVSLHRLACSEFPNDNPQLHCGALWVSLTIGEPPSCELPRHSPHVEPSPRVEMLPPAPAEIEAETLDALPAQDEETLDALAEDDDREPIEIVDDLGFDDAVDESPTRESATVISEAAPDEALMDEAETGAASADPFAKLAGLVKDVARTFGADEDGAARLDTLLGLDIADAAVEPQAAAWRGILRGESEDYDACGAATLDEWAADVVARVVGGAGRSDGIRRELRRRGVAAFGLVA
jgi:hypothetical protein